MSQLNLADIAYPTNVMTKYSNENPTSPSKNVQTVNNRDHVHALLTLSYGIDETLIS
jgi:hypothetical protein